MLRTPTLSTFVFAIGLAGCVLTPSRVGKEEIDDGLGLGAYNIICKGLEMEDPEVREYAVTKFHKIQEPIAAECVCEHIMREGVWDDAVARGLKGAKRDDMVACLADVLDDPAVDREVELVTALKLTGAPLVPDRLYAFAKRAEDPKARAIAVSGLLGSTEQERIDFLLDTLANDASPEVRVAALKALRGQDSEVTTAAMRKAYAEDQDGVVRLEALRVINDGHPDDRDELICGAIMDDPAPEVRMAAIGMYKGTKREVALSCLRKRAFTTEEDGKVRQKLLDILGSSRADEAADILCELVPVWLAEYAADDIIYKIDGLKVMEAQNDRDWERSLECAQRAYAKRGKMDCYGKQYIAHWVRELGGSAHPPPCPKTDGEAAVYKQAAGTGGAGVISFE
jgi:hypothetical protein